MELKARDIRFTYQGTDFPLFDRFCFSIDSPGFYSLFGFSGCGKSTLARIVAGLLKPDEGILSSDGIDTILLCYNSERFPGWLPVGLHLDRVRSASIAADTMERLIGDLGLGGLLHKRFSSLSMGQRNRANLARYLLQDFDVLICDEVMANVDEPTRNEILSILKKRYCENRIVLYISHNVEEVCFFSKKIFVMSGSGTRPRRLAQVEGLDGKESEFGRRIDDRLRETIFRVLMAASGHGEAEA